MSVNPKVGKKPSIFPGALTYRSRTVLSVSYGYVFFVKR